MLYSKTNAFVYQKEFQKRFTNFCDKSPVLLSFNMTPTNVQVIDETQDFVFEFLWDYTLSPKGFIHAIKEVLQKKCYPRIIRTEILVESIPPEEQAKMIEDGRDISKVPTKKEIKRYTEYIIDKIIVYKDIFVLRDIGTNRLFRYKLNKSSIFFLKKLRNGQTTKETAGQFFFDNATFLNELQITEKE